jgi:hypothetical protein
MGELIVTIILIISLGGLLVIIFRKIPVLVELPKTTESPVLADLRQRLKEKIKNLLPLKSFSSEVFIQKILSRTRVLTLRIENKIANYLQKLREKAQKKNFGNDNYWQELKKSKDQEDKK